jgi:predicted SAM-dependent methyltransferase
MDGGFKRLIERSRFLLAMVRPLLFCREKCRRLTWYLTRPRAIRRYLRSHQIRKLEIGAWPNIQEGWLHTDVYPTSGEIIFLDARKLFPFEDGIFDYVFSEHLIEHLTYKEGLFMLGECYRVLKPGGRIRIATPDLETLVGLYVPEKSELQQRYIRWITDKFLPEVGVYRASFVINNAFRNWGHQFIYDRATLQSAMEEVGFVGITRYAAGESDDEALRGIESHGKSAGNEDMNRFETMVLEAKRPM